MPLALSACASMPSAPTKDRPPVTLVSAFAGRKTGQGHFRVWLTGAERRFDAALAGRVSGAPGQRRLTVVEDSSMTTGRKTG